MYDPGKCTLCGECLAGCAFLGFSPDEAMDAMTALAQGETPGWLDRCMTCYACTERCPNGADPFSLICRRHEERGAYVPAEVVRGVHAHFSAQGEFTPPALSGTVVSACTIYNVTPESYTSKIFAGLPLVRGRHFFCNVLYTHLGNLSLYVDGLARFVGNLAATGADRVVLTHEDCWAAVKEAVARGIEIPFTPVHLYEYLLEYLDAHPDEVRPLGISVAFQRPCAARFSPEKDALADEIFSRIGVTRAARKYDREDALCCGMGVAGLPAARDAMGPFRDANIADAKAHGADLLACLCPMCMGALKAQCDAAGIIPVFLVDLVRAALGEIALPGA